MKKKQISFSRYTLSRFLKELGSSSSSPGGGSAAGLCGSLGTALIEMVARINDRRLSQKQTGAKDPIATDRISTLSKARLQFEKLITSDCKVFLKISKLYKDKAAPAKYQAALHEGASVPFEMAQLSAKIMALGILELDRTSRWLISDLMEASILLPAAFYSAKLNIEINLKSIEDPSFVEEMKKNLLSLEEEIHSYKKKYTAL